MEAAPESQLGVNSWFEDELRSRYKHDRSSVDDSWKAILEKNGATKSSNGSLTVRDGVAAGVLAIVPPVPVGPDEELIPLRGAAARIAENMTASLTIPLATSQRVLPVKVIDENRRLLNHHRALTGKSKISFTHLIGWAIVKAVKAVPGLNTAFTVNNGEPCRIVRPHVNLGIAIDVAGKNGARSLVVPNIKNADGMMFPQYVAAFDDLVARGRSGKLTPTDFAGTTITLTNPGTVGTLASIPRLMVGQGAIIATGSMDYPPGARGLSQDNLAALGLSKVMSVTCTYDHRIIQGAESGALLGKLEALLNGEESFYDEIFASLRVPYRSVKWEADKASATGAIGMVPASELAKQAAVMQLIHAYRVRGHLMADLDPLGGEGVGSGYHPELDPLTYGLTVWDLDRSFFKSTLGLADSGDQQQYATLREILDQLRATYCGKIGAEYMHIMSPEEKTWLQHHMEPFGNNEAFAAELRKQLLSDLLRAEEFERFLHARFVGQKRFSLEGAETAVPILEEILDLAGRGQVAEVVMGMAHRGRLTVLATCVGKPLTAIFSEFEGYSDPDSIQGSGDVKYHLGSTNVRRVRSGAELRVSLSPNPSHLEAVDPVVEGIVRPKQDRLGDKERKHVIPLLIHGDAAFAGQGVVAETLNLSQLDGYSTGGTVHLIINNQIGFTTMPSGARSSTYSTDVARMVQAPIFHVNGDDPEAATRVARFAFEFRQQFNKDVVIDMVCYRRHGHNEGDDPGYTQPNLYRRIKDQPSVAILYGNRLIREKVLSKAEVDTLRKEIADHLAQEFDAAKGQAHNERPEHEEFGADEAVPFASAPSTSAPIETLARVVEGASSFPPGFTVHPKLLAFTQRRKESLVSGGPIDWAFAETLAFGSLCLEGTPVRLSGQDSGRGTFSQRHLAFYDYEDSSRYVPLQHLSPTQAPFEVYDSSLSEYAVVGFEYGYSVADPLTLVLWEAQFGDFANGAQIMIDQFISTSEEKWGQPTGLVMLLPHGQEGQGPEHSSARLERFLILCARDNMQIVNCTTPAQYFHLLRRQMREGADMRGKRKPLIVFTPKSILRHPKAVSSFAELTEGRFWEVLPGAGAVNAAQVERILFCSGKVYYDLLSAWDQKNPSNVLIVRIEQLYPFAADQVKSILEQHPNADDIVWVQEEPKNMGAWRFVAEQFALLTGTQRIRYVGREENSSPATGSKKVHDQEQSGLVAQAFA